MKIVSLKMSPAEIENEQKILDFASQANTILWNSPDSDSKTDLIKKFGPQRAKEKTLLLLFRATKKALGNKRREFDFLGDG
jgi:hypothetical protein